MRKQPSAEDYAVAVLVGLFTFVFHFAAFFGLFWSQGNQLAPLLLAVLLCALALHFLRHEASPRARVCGWVYLSSFLFYCATTICLAVVFCFSHSTHR